MKQPSPMTYVLASPPVFYGSWGVSLFFAYGWTQDGSLWPLVAMAGAFLLAVMKADERLRAYKLWKREWDSYDDSAPRRPLGRLGVIGFVFVLGCVIAAQLPPRPQDGMLLATLIVSLCVWGFWPGRGGKAKPPRRVKAKPELVTVCVTRPVFSVPSMQDAYRALPEHCLRMG